MAAGRSQSSCSQCMHIFYSENQNVVLVSQCTKIAYQKYKIGFTEKERKKNSQPQRWFHLPFIAKYTFTQNMPLTKLL